MFAGAKKAFLVFLERLSFALWIAFTVFCIVLIGIGADIICYSTFIEVFAGSQPHELALVNTHLRQMTTGDHLVLFPLALIVAGVAGSLLSFAWRQYGINHFHYLEHDALVSSNGEEETPSSILDKLIREVEESSGAARSEARAKAKAWLLDHVTAMDHEEIELARTHFGYLLPAEWGLEIPA